MKIQKADDSPALMEEALGPNTHAVGTPGSNGDPDVSYWEGLLSKSIMTHRPQELPVIGLDDDPKNADWPKRTWDWPGGVLLHNEKNVRPNLLAIQLRRRPISVNVGTDERVKDHQ